MEYRFLSSYKWTSVNYDGTPVHHDDVIYWLYDSITKTIVETESGWESRRCASRPEEIQTSMNIYMKEASVYRVKSY